MKRNMLLILLLAAAPWLGCAALGAQQSPPPAQDNTQQNQRDRSQGQPTADQAKNNVSDRDAMQKIRKSIVADKTLSSYAHNVKIIAQNGHVTLRGPVRSEDERNVVRDKAAAVVGAENVTDEITIQPPHQK